MEKIKRDRDNGRRENARERSVDQMTEWKKRKVLLEIGRMTGTEVSGL